jgi:hypothetical protein
LDADQRHQLNSHDDFPYPERHLRIDNTHLAPEQVAQRILVHFSLALRPAG